MQRLSSKCAFDLLHQFRRLTFRSYRLCHFAPCEQWDFHSCNQQVLRSALAVKSMEKMFSGIISPKTRESRLRDWPQTFVRFDKANNNVFDPGRCRINKEMIFFISTY